MIASAAPPLLGAVVLCCGTPTAAADAVRHRGPLGWRDEFLLAQPTMTLPAESPYLLRAGRTEVRVHADWGNDFGLSTGPGGRARDLRFVLDGEHRSLAVSVRHAPGGRTVFGLRTGVQWRGGGWLDEMIDPFHGALGLPDGGRPLYPRNRLAVEGQKADGSAITWTGRPGTGLLPVELEAGRALLSGSRGALSAFARVRLPTATGPFSGSGAGAAVQMAGALGLGRRFDAYAGAGLTAFGPDEVHGLAYRTRRQHGFLALEGRVGGRASLVAQLEASSRLVEDVLRYPGFQLALRLGAAVDAGPWALTGGFVEGLKDLENTADFGVFLGLSRDF